MDIVVPICLGLALSAAAGLRAFLPFFLLGLLSRFGHIDIGASFSGLSDTPVLVGLAVAVVVELSADKVPALDNVLDVVGAPVRTIAGMVVFAAVLTDMPGWAQGLLAIVAGGGAAATTHTTKSLVRLGSSAVTGGVANPVISFVEDGIAIATTILSVLFAAVAVVLGGVVVVVVFLAIRRLVKWLRGRGAPPDATGEGQAPPADEAPPAP